MAIPYYTYPKLKLPGPKGDITVSSFFEQAYVSSREHFDLAATTANSTELTQLQAAVAECRPDPGKPSPSSTFIPTEETKAIAIDPSDPTKTIWISAQLTPK
ncbi:uncharacterized protein LOC120683062 [Panicum virgatum]|uniref:uncharacterized protein LOC120683062 n=1 Tax=Panicum virgatum TaxID=38727 RepID=UPI0019D63B35|nr:uncharacterized protein LOC120683062 [Panicum virgatum]